MVEDSLQQPLSSDQLWLTVINEGTEDRVEVNQRMLIDKMLARYSSDFVICRELIQNSDDAQATSFTLQITCQPSIINSKQSNQVLEDMEQVMTSHLHCNGFNSNSADQMNYPSSENDFHNFLITEIRAINNGHRFTDEDWKRVITIAEGNTNVNAIGQFGVGFFSVFAYSERPMIQSGKQCLAFVWHNNGKSLTTFRKELPLEQQSSTSTAIILPMKTKYILQNEAIDDIVHEIIPIVNLTDLKAYFTKVLSFTKHINELIIQINNVVVFQVMKTRKSLPSPRMHTNHELNFLRFKSFVQTEQTFRIIDGPMLTLNHLDVEAAVMIDEDFHRQIESVLKKRLPSTIHLEFLFPSTNVSFPPIYRSII